MFYMLINDSPLQYVKASGFPKHPFVPWGIAPDGHCIWARFDRPKPPSTVPHRLGSALPDSNQNNARKTRFESELAALVLSHQHLVLPVVRSITQDIYSYILGKLNDSSIDAEERNNMADDVAVQFRKYLWTQPQAPFFGTLGDVANAPGSTAEVVNTALDTVRNSTNVALHLNFHRLFAEHLVTLMEEDESELEARSRALSEELRPLKKYTNPPPLRATRQGITATPTTSIGILAPGENPVPGTTEAHVRAVDKVVRPTLDKPETLPFFKGIIKHDMPYVAGISGSTTALFVAAKLMNVTSQEALKTYAMAVLGFLLGGGNHSFHEVMKTAKPAGVPYKSGKYTSVIPAAFTSLWEYNELATKYGDLLQ